jgi:hypothetical protein
MNSKIKCKFELINNVIDLSVISNKSIILNSYQVYSNPAKIESIEVIKVNSMIKKIRNQKTYELKPHRIIVKQNKNDNNIIISDEIDIETVMSNRKVQSVISKKINSCFIKSLNNNCDIEVIKYYNRGFIKNLLSKRNPNDIISKIGECNWIFTSKKIADEISKSDKFISIGEKVNGFNWYGNIDNIFIYIDDDIKENEIYVGRIDSIMSIINRNSEIETFDCGNFYDEGLKITIEYTFINNGIRKLIIK